MKVTYISDIEVEVEENGRRLLLVGSRQLGACYLEDLNTGQAVGFTVSEAETKEVMKKFFGK